MTVDEARNIVKNYQDQETVHTEEDIFIFTEAMNYLIEAENNPADIMALADEYYAMMKFDLALKYYELAADKGFEEAGLKLGSIHLYGLVGKPDYQKAYSYFFPLYNEGYCEAIYKIADMYKDGLAVKKDKHRYYGIIEELYNDLYEDVRRYDLCMSALPETEVRLAEIRASQRKIEEAEELFDDALFYVDWRIKEAPTWTNLELMKRIVCGRYALQPDGKLCQWLDIHDLFYVLQKPHKIRFWYRQEYFIESLIEDDKCVVKFDDKWFRNAEDFIRDAVIGNMRLICINDINYFELIE